VSGFPKASCAQVGNTIEQSVSATRPVCRRWPNVLAEVKDYVKTLKKTLREGRDRADSWWLQSGLLRTVATHVLNQSSEADFRRHESEIVGEGRDQDLKRPSLSRLRPSRQMCHLRRRSWAR